MYAIIPDIHGDYERLEKTLKKAGFKPTNGESWKHPQGTKAVFLGDFIDGGSENRRVIETVRAMIGDTEAHAIMGNHELNAIMYHTPKSNNDGWLRSRNDKNRDQHVTFLREFTPNADDEYCQPKDNELVKVLNWFKTLPLYLEFDDFKIVHSQWDETAIDILRSYSSNGYLPEDEVKNLCNIGGGIGFAVERLLKGMEIRLPPKVSFKDYRGIERFEMRVQWWAKGERTYRKLALSVPDPSEIPDAMIPDADQLFDFDHGGKPIFVGHYKMPGLPSVTNDASALCLDYPKSPCFYHWRHGDKTIRHDRLILT